MKFSPITLRHTAAAAALVTGLMAACAAHAENHALIMWIGDYGSSRNNLPGIDLDAQNARKIAATMGVSSNNIREVSNQQLTRSNIAAELAGLTGRINKGDKVFVYYSGHGYQTQGVGGARCTEALVARGPELYPDFEFQDALTRLGDKASQVVVMNDSCFSGGAATKSFEARGADDAVPKFLGEGVKGNSAVTEGYRCGDATNKMTRNLEVLGAQASGPRVLYVAASDDTQVSYATPRGSIATLAWAACLTNGAADTNRSGSINGKELQACAQNYINANTRFRQTIMLQGDVNLPISFVSASANAGAGRVNAAQALRDIRAASSKEYQVQLVPAQSNLRIRQDFLDFKVSTNKSGYLYLLQVGSDGKTFNVLFPNKHDANNQISAGTHQFPHASWRVRAMGPAGTSHLLAVVTQTQRDLTKGMDLSEVFASAEATNDTFKTLFVEASGANGGTGTFGASEVAAINETQ